MRTKKLYIKQLSENSLLVISTNHLRTEFLIDDLEKVISDNYKGITEIFFDSLIRNGARNRYFVAKVKNNKVDLSSFEKVKASDEIINESDLFFSKNMMLIENSSMTKAQKFLLRKRLKVVTDS